MKCLLILNQLYFVVAISTFAQVSYIPSKNEEKFTPANSSDQIEKHKLLFLNSGKNLHKLSYDLLQLYDVSYLPKERVLQDHLKILENSYHFIPSSLFSDPELKIKNGKVYVYIFFNSSNQIHMADHLLSWITDTDEKNRMIVAWVGVDKLNDITALDEVRLIRSVLPPVLNTGSVTTEGDAVHRTSDVRATFSNDGTGIKVGIISDGVQNRSSSQETGDLPTDGNGLTVLSAGTGDEGTAMLEIIHDMVPGAQLYFHTYGANTAQFNSAIDNLIAAGCKIICDDVGWITEPFFEDGTVASHVETILAANNIIYVSSAGNAGYTHYQGNFFPLSGFPTRHDFNEGGASGTPYLYVQLSPGETVTVILQWNDQFGNSSNDYDLELRLNSNGSLVASSSGYQTGTQDPLEAFSYTNPSTTQTRDYQIRVINFNGLAANRNLEVYFYPETGSYYTNNIKPQDGIFGHPAVEEVIAVGAVDQTAPSTIEGFSSQGASTITFPSFEVRQKPNIVGVDFVSVTGAGGFPSTFGGTSAAAPHIVSILAQAWSYDLSQTASQVRQLLYDWAVDLGTTGFDNVFGFGRGDALNIFNGALPVELLFFSASIIDASIKLTWRTETESKNYGFEVQKKILNDQFAVDKYDNVGFVQGHGNSNSPKDYTFTDTKVGFGKHFYRLKQIDIDGSINYSKVIEVDLDKLKKFELSQNYPNPFNPVTTINFTLPSAEKVKLTVYNLLGENVKTLVNEFKEAGVHTVNFNSNDFQSGLYLYTIEAGIFIQTRKMILLK